jgi:hypothetical protein
MLFYHEYMRYLFYIDVGLLIIAIAVLVYLFRHSHNNHTRNSQQYTDNKHYYSRCGKLIRIWQSGKFGSCIHHLFNIKDGNYKTKDRDNNAEHPDDNLHAHNLPQEDKSVNNSD